MRIVVFYQYFGTPKGSWSTRIYELTRRWVEAGHQVTVVTAPYEKSDIQASSFISKQKVEGIDLIVINSGDSNRQSFLVRVFNAFRFSLVSIWYSLTLKYDICIASSGPITIGLPMVVSKALRRKPAIFEVRDLWPAGAIELGLVKADWQKKLGIWFERICYNSSNLVVTASIGQKEHIQARFQEKRIEVIPNASDLEIFGKKSNKELPSWTEGKTLFTHIGSLGLIHSTGYWVEVAKELKILDPDQSIVLVFIGEGKDKEELIAESKKFQLENIKFLGLKPKHELPVWVQGSRATLFATLDTVVQNTCSPNKIFDSFAAGVPIVQTSTGWIGDLVEKEDCGVNIPLNSPKEGAKKILWLAENEEVAIKMGQNALRLAEGPFDRSVLAEKYLELIKSAISE